MPGQNVLNKLIVLGFLPHLSNIFIAIYHSYNYIVILEYSNYLDVNLKLVLIFRPFKLTYENKTYPRTELPLCRRSLSV